MDYGLSSMVHGRFDMHILLIHQAFASLDEPGGTRHYELAHLLAGRGHQVTVIASPVSYITGSLSPLHPSPQPSKNAGLRTADLPNFGRGSRSRGEGITILRAKVYSAHHKSFFHRVLAFFSFMLSSFFMGLKVKKVDLVWGTSPPIFQGVTAWALARFKGAKFLFEVRDLWPQFAIAVGVLKNPILIRLSEWLERLLYRRAERVMVNSPGFAAHVTSRGAKRVELIPNGADPSMFDPSNDGADFRRAHHLDGKFVAMYAGAHGISNDLGILLESASLLADEPEIQIVLVGDGKEKAGLQQRAREMNLTNVTFAPSVPKSGIPAALAASDVCIAILKPLEEYKTTYPNKVFDYMAAGRAVALAIDGVIREVVEAAQCGMFSTPGDAKSMAGTIAYFHANRDHTRTMGLAGRAYLERNFSRAALGEKLANVLEQMVK